MSQHVYLTQHGYDRIKSEIEELKTNGRKEAARAIGEAREKGDLSENAEYDAAKDAQGMLEAKIADLEGKISGARIIDETMINNSSVGVLTNVKIENQKTKKQITYKLVPEAEADISTGKISGARIIDETMINNSSVGVLTNVKIENQKTKKQITYKLVPEAEADISTGKISVSSPVGKGLLGKVVGEIAHVTTPNGFLEFKVLEITVG